MKECFARVDQAIMPINNRLQVEIPNWNYVDRLQSYLSDVRFQTSNCVPPTREQLFVIFSRSEVWVADIQFLSRHLGEAADHSYSAGEDTVALQHAIGWLVAQIEKIAKYTVSPTQEAADLFFLPADPEEGSEATTLFGPGHTPPHTP